MKLNKLVGITFFLCSIPAIAPAQAFTLGETSISQEQQIDNSSVPSPFERLGKGINLSENLDGIQDKDLALIKSLQFDHVRLPIDPMLLLDENNPQIVNANYLSSLDSTIDKIITHGLSVVIDLHPGDIFKQKLATDDVFVDKVTQLWGSLARHLSPRNPDDVILEVLNEPFFGNFLPDSPAVNPQARWEEVQIKLANAIRQVAPNHTIVLKGNNGESVADLLKLTPIKEENGVVVAGTPASQGETAVTTQPPSEKYIYNFHFYDDLAFTHQGAGWVSDKLGLMTNLPYPYNQVACTAALAQISDPDARGWAQYYCDQKWDKTKLEDEIAQAANWAKQNNVLLTANEFGVYKNAVSPEDRVAWIRDVRSIFEKYNIGWTMWEYSGGFGLVEQNQNGERCVDLDLGKALGLIGENDFQARCTGDLVQPQQIITQVPSSPENTAPTDTTNANLPASNENSSPVRRVPEPTAFAGMILSTLLGMGLTRRRR